MGGESRSAAGDSRSQKMTQPTLHSTFNIDPFDKSKSKFSRWVARLEGAFGIFGISEEAKKLALLLHYMGQETYDVLCDKMSPAEPTSKSYAQIVCLLDQHFDPQPLEIVENYRFHLRKQQDGESIDEFLTALRRLSMNCKFGTYLDTAIRNQLVFGLRSQKIQDRLLETKDLTLEKAKERAIAMEMSAKGGAEIHSTRTVSHIHSLRDHQQPNRTQVTKDNNSIKKSRKIVCYRCGSETHLANACRFKTAVCNFCKKTGHLAKMCLSAKNCSSSNKNMKYNNKKKGAHYVEEREVDELCNIVDTSNIFISNKKSNCNRSKIWIKLKVQDVFLNFEIDTGSPVSLISKADKAMYFRKLPLNESDTTLVSYCNNEIIVHGYINVEIEQNSNKKQLKLYVVDSDRHPLLGREWLHEVQLDWNTIFRTNIVQNISQNKNVIDLLVQKYPKVFEKSVGKITDIQAKLTLKPNFKPVFFKARPVPFSIRKAVENEIADLVDKGIFTKVDHSAWATPIVPVSKAGNRVRLCGDYKVTVNPNLLIDEHPLPTIEELFASMAGGKKFSKIDLTQAYLQLEVRPEDREILTLSTHKGLFQPNRLMYGIASAPAIWQRQIEQILIDIEGTTVFLDDIKITGPDDRVHLHRLEEVLKRLEKYNMRVNFDKCEFFAKEIFYCGYVIDERGIHKMKNKIDAIQEMKRPSNKDEIRAFTGLVNYYGRFFEHLSTTLYPINNLLKNDIPFLWDKKCEDAFKKVKSEMQSDKFLVHYDPRLPLLLATDASPYGVGAVLSHLYENGTERPIQYASQTLNATQQRYSQIDKEAYAIIFGIRKFYQYIYGRKFTLVTDNKPVLQIFSPKKGLPTMSAMRMQHYAIFLQSFDYDIKYKNSKDHGNADGMSRLPIVDCSSKIEEIDIVEINMIENLPLTVKELSKATLADENVKVLLQGLKNGRPVDSSFRFGINQSEFSLQQDCLMRGVRVYIPKGLRTRVLEELHSTHFGISRMKSLARGYCWWENIDKDIEHISKNCTDCQSVQPNPARERFHSWETPTEPFQRIHGDFAGPMMGGIYLLILVDAFSKWIDVRILNKITADATIMHCRDFFSTFGIPSVFVSDHGTQFTSWEFKNFLKMNGVVHKMGAPYHPSTNGQAERYVKTIKHKLNALKCGKQNLSAELCNILLIYRKTIHPATGKSPSMIVFNRQIRSRIDLMVPSANKESMKEEIPHIKRAFNIQDRVAVREYLDKKTRWKFGKIVDKQGKLHYLVRLDDGREWKRHVDQIRSVGNGVRNLKDSDPVSIGLEEDLDFPENQENIENSFSSNKSKNSPRKSSDATSDEDVDLPNQSSSSENVTKEKSNKEQIVEENCNSDAAPPPIRKSSRVRKAPNRLNL